MDPIRDTTFSMDTADDSVMPHKGLEVQFLVEKVIVLNEVIESSAAA